MSMCNTLSAYGLPPDNAYDKLLALVRAVGWIAASTKVSIPVFVKVKRSNAIFTLGKFQSAEHKETDKGTVEREELLIKGGATYLGRSYFLREKLLIKGGATLRRSLGRGLLPPIKPRKRRPPYPPSLLVALSL
ncbi:hypothetical protein HaLaN_20889 [Haematococcus lacustris]|uniref:Uncharacterized protein n=1 Tax=Haematococcus lacustris TaxID=44745 RepID=A0A699ZMV5_HAELA|nr:hypothetical protein HaLaN_20889 [Haematococcus lacustris]